jgi:hypothetical protein
MQHQPVGAILGRGGEEVNWVDCLGFFLILVMLIGAAWAWRSEAKEWNGGICAKSGKPWINFDVDSHGSRGYKDGEGHYMWASWPVDREAKK